jgi:hypothetical protein
VRASCMNCKVEWTKKDLVDYFSIGFVLGKYKEHREHLLFEFEKALLPDTVDFAYRVKRARDLNAEISLCETNMTITNQQFSRLVNDTALEFNLTLLDEVHRLNKLRYTAQYRLANLSETGPRHRDVQKVAKRYFPCSTVECRGFIGMSNWTCQICNVVFCEHCMEPRTNSSNCVNSSNCANSPEHTCNADTVNTIKMLKSDSKNCPKCMAFIYRISGCPQMFCTVCHTAFDWNTGNIVDRGTIHNPHYFDYIRSRQAQNNEEDAGGEYDGECGDEIHYTQFIRRHISLSRDPHIAQVYQVVAHLEHVILPRNRPPGDGHNMNRNLRVQYILKEITIDKFKSELHKREKSREKKKEISDILTTFITVVKDIFRREYRNKNVNSAALKEELHAIREYTNKSLDDNVKRIFKCVTPVINDNWTTTDYYVN